MDWSPSDRSPGRNYHFMVSAVAPRPIAWVTTVAAPDAAAPGVVNLAPFSWYQAICADPPMVMIAFADKDGAPKDTLRNIVATKEFTLNAVTPPLGEVMVASSASYPAEVSEPEELGIELEPSRVVAPPRVAQSPFHLECRLVETHRYGATEKTTVVVGEVVHVHANDDVLDERGNIDNERLPLLARLGGSRYVATNDLFELRRP